MASMETQTLLGQEENLVMWVNLTKKFKTKFKYMTLTDFQNIYWFVIH